VRQLLQLSIVLFLLPCCKKNLSGTETHENNNFGVLVNASASDESLASSAKTSDFHSLTSAAEFTLVKNYGTKYVRLAITHEMWYSAEKASFLSNYDQYASAGIQVLLNLNWTRVTEPPQLFEGDTPEYENYVNDVMGTLTEAGGHIPPTLYVIENEEANPNYRDINNDAGNSKKLLYINMVNYVLNKANNPAHVPVTNGGLSELPLIYLTAFWMGPSGKAFAKTAMPPSNYYGLYPGESLPDSSHIVTDPYPVNPITNNDYFLSQYALMPNLTYINIHWYEPMILKTWDDSKDNGSPYVVSQYTSLDHPAIDPNHMVPNALENVLGYLFSRLQNKKIISNEIGQLTNSFCLTEEIVNTFIAKPQGQFDFASWYDGDGAASCGCNATNVLYFPKSLHNYTTGNVDTCLRNSGLVFQSLMKRTTSSITGTCQ
jgi:hypothetical protein